MNPWLWAVAALVIGLAELHAPGVYLIWIALGAALTAIAAWSMPLALEGQLICFAAASALSCVAGYFVYRAMVRPEQGEAALNRRGRQLIGAHAVVMQDIVNGEGRIRVGDSVWIAQGPDLAAGTPVIITAMNGTAAIVQAA